MPQTRYSATTANAWQIDADNDGPRIEHDGMGALEVRSSDGVSFATLRVSLPHLASVVEQLVSVGGGGNAILRRPTIANGAELRILSGSEVYIL